MDKATEGTAPGDALEDAGTEVEGRIVSGTMREGAGTEGHNASIRA